MVDGPSSIQAQGLAPHMTGLYQIVAFHRIECAFCTPTVRYALCMNKQVRVPLTNDMHLFWAAV